MYCLLQEYLFVLGEMTGICSSALYRFWVSDLYQYRLFEVDGSQPWLKWKVFSSKWVNDLIASLNLDGSGGEVCVKVKTWHESRLKVLSRLNALKWVGWLQVHCSKSTALSLGKVQVFPFFKTHFELLSYLVFNHFLLVMKSLRCNVLPDFPFKMFPYNLHNDVWARRVELET